MKYVTRKRQKYSKTYGAELFVFYLVDLDVTLVWIYCTPVCAMSTTVMMSLGYPEQVLAHFLSVFSFCVPLPLLF